MATPEETFKRTMKTKAALDLFRALKKFQELLESGIDSDAAFLQAFWGVYYAVPPVPRPDYIGEVKGLYDAMKEAHLHLTELSREAEEAMAYLKGRMG